MLNMFARPQFLFKHAWRVFLVTDDRIGHAARAFQPDIIWALGGCVH